MPRPPQVVLAAAVIAAVAGACGGGEDAPEPIDRASACRAVAEHLDVRAIEERFGEADARQDFFGDTILTFRAEGGDWKLQVSERVGAFRALRQQKDGAEEILPCRQ